MVIAYEEVVIDSDHQFNLLEAAKKEAEVAKQEASFLSDKFDNAVKANVVLSNKLLSEKANRKRELSSLRMKIDEQVKMHASFG
eukprot:scaffold13631_cov38-Cyclotella_meneghiniana.AAC.8